MTKYYVSSNIGNNVNAGASESAPVANVRAAVSDTAAGHTPRAAGVSRLRSERVPF